MAPLLFSISCIDFRFDAMVAEFYKSINKEYNYFTCSVAGGAMALGYSTYCCKNDCKNNCNPKNATMSLFKKNLIENLKIALSLKPITEIYLLNHQDCGAIKAFLPQSGYPKVLGENNKKEIIINSKLLTYADNYIKRVFPDIKLTLGIVDINGTIATYNIHTKVWTVIYIGKHNITSGLWHGLVVGDVYKN
jgi:hypothetical protein